MYLPTQINQKYRYMISVKMSITQSHTPIYSILLSFTLIKLWLCNLETPQSLLPSSGVVRNMIGVRVAVRINK